VYQIDTQMVLPSSISFLSYPLRQTAGVAKTRQQQRADKKRRESAARKLAARSPDSGQILKGHEQTLWSDPIDPSGASALGVAAESVGGYQPNGSRRSLTELAELFESVELLLRSGLTLSVAGSEFRAHFDAIVDRLVDADGVLASETDAVLRSASIQRPEPLLAKRIAVAVPRLWECGWQPLDLVHAARKERNPRIARLAGVFIRAEASSFPGSEHMPDEWADQLAAIPSLPNTGSGALDPLKCWRLSEQLSMADTVHDALQLLGLLQTLPRLTVLCDPPSTWSSTSKHSAKTSSVHDGTSVPREGFSGEPTPEASGKTLSTIRALLAKAEATTFEAEREVFAAKAQDLMTRYSIDAALLDQRHGEQLGAGVRKRRFHLDNPYATEKVYLLATVARLNNVKIVYEDRFAMATAIGFPTDIELSDLLFTSLLVQAAKGLQDLVASAGKGRTSSPAFRRAYWVAYGVRIGERLTEARAQATREAEAMHGGALVLVMKEREEAVTAVTDELFKNTKKMKTRQLDSDGWDAGRAAAGNANLGTPNARLRA
jgi:Protein of unknown function (DUF2786)